MRIIENTDSNNTPLEKSGGNLSEVIMNLHEKLQSILEKLDVIIEKLEGLKYEY